MGCRGPAARRVQEDDLIAILAAAEAQPPGPDAEPQPSTPSEAALRSAVQRAADMTEAEYALARAALAAGLSVGVMALDKLRSVELKRRRAEACENFAALDDATAMEAEAADADLTAHGGGQVRWPPGFTMREGGLFLNSEADRSRIAGTFRVLGKTRDLGSNGWGLALGWCDDDGAPHRELIPGRLIHTEPGALETRLQEGGLFVSPEIRHRVALREALAGLKTTARVRRVPRCGWHQANAGDAPIYVLPDGVTIGTTVEQVILDGATADLAARCGTAGTLAGWQLEVAARAVGNPAAAFCIAMAFAGPILDLAGEPSGGFHLAGPSKIGKTTAAQMGVSVWGPPYKTGALRDWRTRPMPWRRRWRKPATGCWHWTSCRRQTRATWRRRSTRPAMRAGKRGYGPTRPRVPGGAGGR